MRLCHWLGDRRDAWLACRKELASRSRHPSPQAAATAATSRRCVGSGAATCRHSGHMHLAQRPAGAASWYLPGPGKH